MKIECSSNWENEDGRYYEINTLNAWYGETETGDNRRNTPVLYISGAWKMVQQAATGNYDKSS